MLLPAEKKMWLKEKKERPKVLTDEQIEAKYNQKEERIVTETNREKLQNFYEALKRPNYMDVRPFYQRRLRWDAERQSRLIESFLINIPIPPLFVYEVKPNVYEVMDGQQRISAIKDFYSNELTLTGLTRWPELNGRKYAKLPERIRSGIDRRSISWVTVLHESTDTEDDAFALKQLVFERLNTGGVELSHQEIRNALYAGPFNSMLISLSRLPSHRKAWGLPEFSEAELTSLPEYLAKVSFYREMEDVEIILRFFALRNAEHYQKGMRGFLDLYMLRARNLSDIDLNALAKLYEQTINNAVEIFGDKVFRPYDPNKGWGQRPQKAFADAVLVGLTSVDDATIQRLKQDKNKVLEQVQELFILDAGTGTLTGRGNTKKDVEDRIEALTKLFQSF
jgi:hypothetical protein